MYIRTSKEATMSRRTRANMMLFLTAAIWGFGFVAQRFGAMHVPAFTFNGFRFIIGAISLIPLLIYNKNRSKANANDMNMHQNTKKEVLILGGILAGLSIFLASWLQQVGMETTEPGKAAFLTACYVILVPILGIVIRNKIKLMNWVAIVLALLGLYLLCIKGGWQIAKGDFFELAGAVFWATQILIVDKFVDKVDSIELSFVQFLVCAILCFAFALGVEQTDLAAISKAIIPILYGGIGSVGIAYTLQTVAQRDALPSHAALILSSETLFGTLGGLIFFKENLGGRGYLGCILIIIGILISISSNNNKEKTS